MNNLQCMASRIKALCDEKRISINKMLTESQAGARTYHNMLSGSFPSADKLDKLANYLGVTTDYLLGRTDSPHPTNITNDINKQNNAKTVSIQTALSTEEKELIESFRSFPAEYKAKMINFIHDTKTEIEKDRKLDMLIEQNRKLIHARAAAYGGETADVILTPEEDAKIDELLQKERERKAKNGDDIL